MNERVALLREVSHTVLSKRDLFIFLLSFSHSLFLLKAWPGTWKSEKKSLKHFWAYANLHQVSEARLNQSPASDNRMEGGKESKAKLKERKLMILSSFSFLVHMNTTVRSRATFSIIKNTVFFFLISLSFVSLSGHFILSLFSLSAKT